MAESLGRFKSYIGKSETATDVVTASVMLKFVATLGLERAPLDKGEPVPPGWHGGFFPPSHRPAQMREDGQVSGGSLIPAIPLPRRRIGGNRTTFHEPLRVGDEIKKVGPSGFPVGTPKMLCLTPWKSTESAYGSSHSGCTPRRAAGVKGGEAAELCEGPLDGSEHRGVQPLCDEPQYIVVTHSKAGSGKKLSRSPTFGLTTGRAAPW